MDEKKTAIWHGGLAALLASDASMAREGAETEPCATAQPEPVSTAQDTRVDLAAAELLAAMHAEALRERQSEPEQAADAVKTQVTPNFHRSNVASGTRIMGSWLTPEGHQSVVAPEAGPTNEDAAESLGATRAQSSDPPVTRVLPIEALFPEAHSAAAGAPDSARTVQETPTVAPDGEAKPAQADTSEGQRAPTGTVRAARLAKESLEALRGLVAGKSRERVFLYGGLVVFVVLLLGFRALRADGRAESPRVARAAIPSHTPRADVAPVSKALPAAVAVPSAVPLAAPNGLERAATDALARGDYVLAQRIYAELATRVPAPSPYSEAARILARAAEPETP